MGYRGHRPSAEMRGSRPPEQHLAAFINHKCYEPSWKNLKEVRSLRRRRCRDIRPRLPVTPLGSLASCGRNRRRAIRCLRSDGPKNQAAGREEHDQSKVPHRPLALSSCNGVDKDTFRFAAQSARYDGASPTPGSLVPVAEFGTTASSISR
jgi:hypothetical protein